MKRGTFLKSILALPFVGFLPNFAKPDEKVTVEYFKFPDGFVAKEYYYWKDNLVTHAKVAHHYIKDDKINPDNYEIVYYEVKNTEKVCLEAFKGQIDVVFMRPFDPLLLCRL